MATEIAPNNINGTYHGHHHQVNPYPTDHYNTPHMGTAPSAHYTAQPHNTHSAAAAPPSNDSKNDIPKDEVGWFFVEQYYTTLSRSPEKLHLFYSRKSQFVSGVEAEKVNVAVGQKSINERIKELSYQDCKVRVLNVDSQSSFDNILVVVIGEISNKSAPPRKFVQTFVLAEQQNGYYVLNDIIRYLNDEDEEVAAKPTTATEEAPVEETTEQAAEITPSAPERQADSEAAAKEVDEKLEKEVAVNGDSKQTEDNEQPLDKASVEEAQPIDDEASVSPAPVPAVPATAEAIQPENPKEPEPSPAAVSPEATTPAPEKGNAPAAKPPSMTWASIASSRAAAAAAAAAAASSSTAPTTVATPALVNPAPPAAQTNTTAASAQPTATTAETENIASQASSNSEWQTAGAENARRQSRPQAVGPTEERALAYIKNVNEKVDASLLRQTLGRFGKLKYYDVNRQRSCAFVEFADSAGYKAAVAANPHQIGTEQVTVEERRPRPNAYGGSANYGSGRGSGGPGRGRGDRSGSQNRGGFQKESGRFTPRGRGGNITPKGRGQPQAV